MDSRFEIRIEILEDRTLKLDYNSVVASLKEAEQRIKKSEDKEEALVVNNRSKRKLAKGNNPNRNKQIQRKRKEECWCCGEEGHVKTECQI